MDIYQALRALHEEKKRLDHLIAVLEELQNAGNHIQSPALNKRRGRKSMSLEERRQVSERMKRYWAQRRERQQAQDEQEAPAAAHSGAAAG